MSTGAAPTPPVAAPSATVVMVTYKTETVDLHWIPTSTQVLIVQNDTLLRADRIAHPRAKLIGTCTNVGFGAAVNDALALIHTRRLIVVNPDTELTAEHWAALSEAADDEVVVIPLDDGDGNPTSVVNAYPTPVSLLLTALRVGRLVPRSSRARQVLAAFLGAWGRSHASSLSTSHRDGRWPISTHWPAAAVCSYPTELVRAAGGFDVGYFLYLEDIDLARRLGDETPTLQVVVADVVPGVHLVGGSARDLRSRKRVHLEQARSATRYARSQRGQMWKAAGAATGVIAWVRSR